MRASGEEETRAVDVKVAYDLQFCSFDVPADPCVSGTNGGDGERRAISENRETRAGSLRRQVLRRQRLDANEFCAGPDDDGTGSGIVLRRVGTKEKRLVDDDAELRDDGDRHSALGAGLF